MNWIAHHGVRLRGRAAYVKYCDEQIANTGVSDLFVAVFNITVTRAGLGFNSRWWHFREAPEEAVQFAMRSHQAGAKCGVNGPVKTHLRDARNTTVSAQRPTAKREVWVRNHIGEFKGCQWHSSKGGS